MGRLIVWNLVTLDGCFEGPKPWDLAFHERAWGPELNALSEDFGASAEALVFGRKTYEGMAEYWPTADEEPVIKDFMNRLPKLVASRSLTDPAWSNTRATTDILAELRALKAASERPVFIFGSGELVRSLLPEGIIDEFRLALVPVILGRGRRLFGEDGPEVPLRLVGSETTAGGTVVLTYATA